MTRRLQQSRREKDEANARLMQAEKLASIGRIAATIAHEIRNPLTSVKLNIQRLAQRESRDEVEREHLALSQEGIAQIEKFVKGFLNYTRVSELNLSRFPMEQILEESLKTLRESFEQKNVRVVRRYEPGLPEIPADGDKLREVFTNILRNALEAVGENGRVEVGLFRVAKGGREWVRVRVADDGCGIPPALAETIFEPFFTTKSSGVGLGLSNARKILEQHRGSIRAGAAAGCGAV
ncbi:MAG: HAMP domain-containing histidine kinase, partial [Candidatus Aminicenantes bacterium]|nr:HAMP domain-containing histidine kinase [Candidatus Aminicenantes bacterium]